MPTFQWCIKFSISHFLYYPKLEYLNSKNFSFIIPLLNLDNCANDKFHNMIRLVFDLSKFCNLIYYKRLVSILYKFTCHITFISSGDHAIFRVCCRTLSTSDDPEDQWECTRTERVNLQ